MTANIFKKLLCSAVLFSTYLYPNLNIRAQVRIFEEYSESLKEYVPGEVKEKIEAFKGNNPAGTGGSVDSRPLWQVLKVNYSSSLEGYIPNRSRKLISEAIDEEEFINDALANLTNEVYFEMLINHSQLMIDDIIEFSKECEECFKNDKEYRERKVAILKIYYNRFIDFLKSEEKEKQQIAEENGERVRQFFESCEMLFPEVFLRKI